MADLTPCCHCPDATGPSSPHFLHREDGDRAQEGQYRGSQVQQVVVLTAGAEGQQDRAEEELGPAVDLTEMLILDWAPHPAEGDKLLIVFDGGHLDQHQVDRLVIPQQELSTAQFFDVEQLAEVMPARLGRRVIYAATGHDKAYLEHGIASTPPSQRGL